MAEDIVIISAIPTHDSMTARLQRICSPGYSYCFRCGRPWNKVESHVTRYTKSRGCFPLCEGCWTLLGSPEARIEYYAMLIHEWETMGDIVDEDDKQDIQRAVANGG